MNHEHLMRGLSVQHLKFTVRPLESILFDNQPGSALRGALYQVLSSNFCSETSGFVTPDHAGRCPVCWLLAAEDQESKRGQNIARPLTVEPPLGRSLFHRDQELTFGFSLIGQAQNMLPYLARAVEKMGQFGVGKGRGRFKLVGIAEYNPLVDAERILLDGRVVKKPTLQVTVGRVAEIASQLSPERITLHFQTPLRLTAGQVLIKSPNPVVFIQRLVERCQSLAEHYAESNCAPTRDEWYHAFQALSEIAAQVKVAYNDTEWVDCWSGSRRQNRYTPISGLVGSVRWEGPLTLLIPWLLWGASLHVGKNAVKGNGWYRIVQ
jgi:hypothetical protein